MVLHKHQLLSTQKMGRTMITNVGKTVNEAFERD